LVRQAMSLDEMSGDERSLGPCVEETGGCMARQRRLKQDSRGRGDGRKVERRVK